jgi:tetratricopeptide (TPR) repeat protein
VRGLRYPENGDGGTLEAYGALKLFLARARQSDSDFTLSTDVRPHVSHICRLVEGMPLGIELAAAWVSVLSCHEIACEISEGIDILATPSRELRDRHRSLRAAFDHSWRLLTEEAKSAFRKLSVFRGSFSREAVTEVADADLVLLSELMSKSLLRRNAQGRYEIHELLRQYASERLDALPQQRHEVKERYSRYYLEFLSVREPDLFGERLREIKDEIRTEMENVRAGVHWAVADWSEADARDALASLDAVLLVEGWHEGKETFAGIVQALQKTREVEADAATIGTSPLLSAMAYQAMYGSLLGETDASGEVLQECLPALGALGLKRELAVCHFALGVNALYRGEFERSQQQFKDSISLARASQAQRWEAHGLMWLGWVLGETGDLKGAKAQYEESYSLYREQGNRWGMAFVLSKQGLVADAEEDHSQAKRYHTEALEILAGFGDQAGQAYVTSRLSLTAYGQGRYAEARHLGRRGYERFEELGHRWGMGASLCRIGFAALGLGRRHEAGSCFHKALKLAACMQHVPLILYSLAGMACLMAEEGKEAQAVELLAFVEEHPQTPPTYLDIAGRWFSGIKSGLAQEALSAARERGAASELDAIVGAVLRDRPED